jgi:hypothetical protein
VPGPRLHQQRIIIAETLSKVTILPAAGAGRRFDRSRILLGNPPAKA